MKCVCGAEEYIESTRSCYEVTSEGRTIPSSKKISVGKCVKCGILRQVGLPFTTRGEWEQFYKKEYPPVGKAYAAKDWKHDKEVASKRCDNYGFGNKRERIKELKVLDVGSGSGAFVDECRKRGLEAYGCEIARYSYSLRNNEEYVYKKALEKIYFPTDYFDVITCHDVIEHIFDPLPFAKELFRITKQDGICIIEFPNFYSRQGKHHWKPIEHIWFFNREQFEKFMKEVGFQ